MKKLIYSILIFTNILFVGCAREVPVPKKVIVEKPAEDIMFFQKIDRYGVAVKHKKNVVEEYKLYLANAVNLTGTISHRKNLALDIEKLEVAYADKNRTIGTIQFDFNIKSYSCDNFVSVKKDFLIKESNLGYTVLLSKPKEINMSNYKSRCNINGDYNKTIALVSNYDKNIFFSSDNVVPLFGEANSQYSVESIYGNFDRKLKKIRDRRYTVNYDGEPHEIAIDIYPYKNGSKITWKSGYTYRYYFYTGKGAEQELKNDIANAKKNIEASNQQILKIINEE